MACDWNPLHVDALDALRVWRRGDRDGGRGSVRATPTYENHIRPILADYCVPCHDSNGVRAGGVELDKYESALGNAVHNACVSITPDLIELFAEALQPQPTDPATTLSTCKDWEPASMPPGASAPMTPHQQVLLARWVEIGAPR